MPPRFVAFRSWRYACAGALLLVAIAWTALPWNSMAIRWRQSRARSFLAERKDFYALSELRRALQLDLTNRESLLLLARAHRRLSDFSTAALLLDHAAAVKADPQRIERERLLILAQSGDLQQAEPYLSTMMVNAGDDGPDICQAFVQGFFSNMRIKDALDLLDIWQRSYPHDPEPLFMRAYLWQSMGHLAQAIPLYRDGLAMAPSNTLMRRRLAEALLDTHQLDAAEAELAICAQHAEDDTQIAYVQARCAYERGNFDLARERLKETLKRAPHHVDARRLKGQLDLAQGRLNDALQELQQVVERRPFDTSGREALGRTLRALGRSDEATVHLEYVAQAETNLRQIDRLVRESLTAPKNADLRYQIGTLMFQYGPPEDAARWMKAAIELDPTHEGAHRALATYFETQGDAANASLHRQLATAGRRS